jgi:hypothetical protein
VENGELEALKEAEAKASRSATTASALKKNVTAKSWWSGMNIWSKGDSIAEIPAQSPSKLEAEVKKEPPVS